MQFDVDEMVPPVEHLEGVIRFTQAKRGLIEAQKAVLVERIAECDLHLEFLRRQLHEANAGSDEASAKTGRARSAGQGAGGQSNTAIIESVLRSEQRWWSALEVAERAVQLGFTTKSGDVRKTAYALMRELVKQGRAVKSGARFAHADFAKSVGS